MKCLDPAALSLSEFAEPIEQSVNEKLAVHGGDMHSFLSRTMSSVMRWDGDEALRGPFKGRF